MQVACAKVSDKAEFVGVGLRNHVDRHGIHARQQVRPERFRKAAEPNLLIMLILKEVFHTVFEDTGLVIVFGDGVDLTLGVGPWPEALFQSAKD